MNALTCPLLLLSLGQTAEAEYTPERPAVLQAPPVAASAEATDRPRQFRIDASSPAPLPDSAAFPAGRYVAPDPPALPRQPAATRPLPRRTVESTRRSVVLTDRTEPVVPVHTNEAIGVANKILDEAVRSIDLGGKSTPLVSVLGSADSTTRARVLKDYWNLSVAIAKYAFAEHEALYLEKLSRPQTRTEDAMLRAQVARGSARRSQARLNALQWQERLSELIPDRESQLPVPADMPFVGVYRTQIDKLFAQGQAPRRLQQIDRSLPHELEIISRRAESIAACERLVSELRAAYERDAASLGQVLQATQDLSTERSAFLDIVLSYNEHIADYSLSVVGPNTSATTLVSTLIHTESATQPALLADSRVRPASAEAPARQNDSPTGFAPSTNGTESPAYRGVDSPFSPGSRSILRP